MDAIKFQLKLFTEQAELKSDKLIPVFHSWIRDKKIGDELLIDVADYAHVADGPGVVLIGHQSDYYMDQADGKLGLLYSRKRGIDGTLSKRITDTLRRALVAAQALEQEPSLELAFKTDKLLLRIQDRLHAPNTEATRQAVEPALDDVLLEFFGHKPRIEQSGGDKDPFTLQIETGSSASITEILSSTVQGPQT